MQNYYNTDKDKSKNQKEATPAEKPDQKSGPNPINTPLPAGD